MKKYILKRTLRSFISLFLVVTIAFVMVYGLVPKDRVFKGDQMIGKLASKPDELLSYKNSIWERLGYLDFVKQQTMCEEMYPDKLSGYDGCMLPNSADVTNYVAEKEAKGWTIGTFEKSGLTYMVKDVPMIQRVYNWYANLIRIDHPGKVQDPNNPNLERKLYMTTGPNDLPAVACSGCEQKYFIYADSNFPFLHLNFIDFNMGLSYPTFEGIPVLDVINNSQGTAVLKDQTFETGVTAPSALNMYSCKYKTALDKLEAGKFNDNYADCSTNRNAPSMVVTSISMGIMALLLSYLIALPFGMFMAARKNKLADKMGMMYIVFIIAVPSLAYIYVFRFIGSVFLGLPDKFPLLGAGHWSSYVLPIISLALPSIGSLLMWVRRYMVDQSTADYVKFARAKGLSQGEIFRKHILRNAIIPIVQGIPSSVVGTVAGAIITETVYAVPGMGKMMPDSISIYNNSMVIALTFIFTGLSIFSVLAGDILITLVDPRITLADKGGRK